jgi:hypothetical protein
MHRLRNASREHRNADLEAFMDKQAADPPSDSPAFYRDQYRRSLSPLAAHSVADVLARARAWGIGGEHLPNTA